MSLNMNTVPSWSFYARVSSTHTHTHVHRSFPCCFSWAGRSVSGPRSRRLCCEEHESARDSPQHQHRRHQYQSAEPLPVLRGVPGESRRAGEPYGRSSPPPPSSGQRGHRVFLFFIYVLQNHSSSLSPSFQSYHI